MMSFLKKIKDRLTSQTEDNITEEKKVSVKETVTQANREVLLLIDPSDAIQFEDMTEGEKRDYVAEASTIFASPVFKNEMKRLMQDQLEFVGKQAVSWDETILGRGNINGIGLIQDRFQMLHSIHLDDVEPKQKVEEHNILPTVTEY